MITVTVGTGKDYAGIDDLCANLLNGGFVAADDYTIDLHPGTVSGDLVISGDLNGKTMLIKSADTAQIQTINDNIQLNISGAGSIRVTGLIIVGAGSGAQYVASNNTGVNATIDNCKICMTWEESTGGVIATFGGVKINNCTILLTRYTNPLSLINFEGTVKNSVICTFNATTPPQIAFTGGVNNNNTIWNYGAGGNPTISLSGGATAPDAILNANPNFVTAAMITSSGDSGMVSRDAHLTSASASCRDNADPATATTTDIEGKVR